MKLRDESRFNETIIVCFSLGILFNVNKYYITDIENE